MARRLGVTGGIGSGKTTVCRIFRVLGVPVFVADMAARQLMNTDHAIREEINAITGEVPSLRGELDRKELARLIFNRRNCCVRSTRSVHPAVLRLFE
ncbi:MAG: dephospho-CoA kinase [Bacteroidales bacterium]|nr:dephospho-CoA kinase [Bacteroidales bacterium]